MHSKEYLEKLQKFQDDDFKDRGMIKVNAFVYGFQRTFIIKEHGLTEFKKELEKMPRS